MESKITGYTLADGESETELIDKVNSLIKIGYQPLGGPVLFTPPAGQPALYQAMVSFVSVRRP